MGEGRSREEWVAGLTLASGGVFLTLAGPPGPAVFWGLTWSIFNGLVLVTGMFKSLKGQLFLLAINFVLAGFWLFASGRGGALYFPLLPMLPLLLPLYLGERRVVVTGLAVALSLCTGWYIKEGLLLQGPSLALLGAAAAFTGFLFLIWSKMAATAGKLTSLQVELDHWRQEYKLSRSQLAAVEVMAVTDDLTRVFNYRYFDQSLERLLNSGQQFPSLAVLMVDIDHFKEINDSYGHLVGNRVLGEMAAILKEHTRERDIVTRFGGEEFAIILPGTDYRGALQVAERIRRAIAEHTFNKEGAPVRLTVSTGLAMWPEDGASKEELVARADLALYQAKTTGRNSVCPYRLLKVDSAP